MMINKINKTVIFGTLFFVLILTSLYFGLACRRLSRELKNQENNLGKTSKEIVEITRGYDKIKNDFAKLRDDYDALSLDRNNTFSRAKELLAENQRFKDLKASLEDIIENNKKEMQLLEKAKDEIFDQNLTFKEKIKDLQTLQKQLIKEKEQLQENLVKASEKSGLKKLGDENAVLKATAKGMEIKLSQKEMEAAKLKESEAKLKEETSLLNQKVNELNKSYAEAVKKNKEFEEKVTRMPARFAEIARQNQALIKRTANIHYNSGVFYSQHKEYARAVDEFEKAIELVPTDAYSHFNAGYIYAEYLVNRPKAVEHFKQYLRFAKKDDKDVDWVRKYIISWESWDGKQPME